MREYLQEAKLNPFFLTVLPLRLLMASVSKKKRKRKNFYITIIAVLFQRPQGLGDTFLFDLVKTIPQIAHHSLDS